MKKLYLSIVILLATLCSTYAQIYVVGDFSGWDIDNPTEVSISDGKYEFDFTGQSIKISTASGDWTSFNAAAYTTGTVTSTSTNTLTSGDANILFSHNATWSVVVDLTNMMLTATPDKEKEDGYEKVYLRGDMNDWATTDEFTTTDGITYTLTGVAATTAQGFKIADASWATINYGGADGIVLGTPYTLDFNTSVNCTLAADVTDATFTFNLTDKTLLVTESGGSSMIPSTLYMFGNVNLTDWSTSDPTPLTLSGSIYSVKGVTIDDAGSGSGYFNFAELKGEDWDVVNGGNRWGAAIKDQLVTLTDKKAIVDLTLYAVNIDAMGCESFMLEAGTYNISIDFTGATPVLTIELDESTGLENTSAAKVIVATEYYTLTGVQIAEADAAGIYVKKITYEDGSAETVKIVK